MRARAPEGPEGSYGVVGGGPLELPPFRSVPALFRERAEDLGGRPALRGLVEGGARRPGTMSWEQWAGASRAVSAALVDQGVEPGDGVAVMAGNAFLWPVTDLGAMGARALSTGVYPTSAPSQIREIVSDAGVRTVVVDTRERLDRLLSVSGGLPRLERIVVRDEEALEHASSDDGIVSWENWLGRGREALSRPEVAREVDRRWEGAGPEDDAILIYTSGSTGRPKGAQLSHRYLLASAASIRDALELDHADTALSFLPFCHAAERVFGLYTRILCGMEAGLVEDHRRLWESARAYEPTLFGGLPRFFEKIHEGLRRDGGSVSDYLGGRVRLATSGGATLKPAVAEGLREEGLTVLGAYGLTEHLCVAFNRPQRHALDSSGPPMPGTELRVAADGEILVRRGPLTFSGYLGRPEESREAFTEDGRWLRTGDLGEVDAEGFLRVTGRKKELLALSTGKMVAPRPVEVSLASDPLIRDAVLVGEGRKFVSALLVPASGAMEEAGGEDALRDRIQEAVDRVNRDLSRSERVRRFALLDRPLSAGAGELTPTGKIRRFRVVENHADLVEALYTTEPGERSEVGSTGGPEDG